MAPRAKTVGNPDSAESTSANEDSARSVGEKRSSERSGPDAGSPIDFATFIMSLATSSVVHLGAAPDPDGRTRKNLELAQQSIDILELLKQKTQGNLSEEEGKLLDELLYDLRLRYVQACQSS